MEIKSVVILGKDGCSNCSRMYQYAQEILKEKNIDAECRHETEYQEILKLGVMSLPGLVINGKVVSYGKILSKADIEKFIDGKFLFF